MVTDLIRATPEEDVIRRDIYDRPPIFKWTEVRAPHSDLINEIGMQDMQILVFAISSFKFEWKGWPTISIGTSDFARSSLCWVCCEVSRDAPSAGGCIFRLAGDLTFAAPCTAEYSILKPSREPILDIASLLFLNNVVILHC